MTEGTMFLDSSDTEINDIKTLVFTQVPLKINGWRIIK